MVTNIENIIARYNPKNIEETKAALREVVQSIILIGLSRAGFFKVASFYGGTALRIFYDLNRYSEDLDFTLNERNNNFSFEPYIKSIKEVAASYNLDVNIDIKNKINKTPIESAFLKLEIYKTFIELKIDSSLTSLLHKDEVLKVKFEVDVNPPLGFNKETKILDIPDLAPIIVLDEPSLFAGKIAAILCREYKHTVKGRDYYDYLFFMKNRISPNLTYLKNKLIEGGKIDENEELSIEKVKKLLIDRFNSIDFSLAIKDLNKFIIEHEDLSIYSKDLFIDLTKRLK